MAHSSKKRYPVNPKDYTIYEEVGVGVSATVHRALCILFNEIVAVKVLDLEKCSNGFDDIRREVQTMSSIDHPNLLHAYCSFTAGRSLWVVMPFMAGGSCLHIMKSAHPQGFEGPVIATLLHEVLKALVYLHGHGHIHRDVKAGNILIDVNGAVKLADFGVSACMFETGDRQRARNTFVGTPCWMAPEVMQQLHGYDFKADIWSFGITALELAHGHAPFSEYPPMKVLLMTLQNAPPGLDYERDKLFPKSFKDLIATCLAKDPKKRPTAEKLLKHAFFKHARSNDYLAKSILDGLAPLSDRFKKLKAEEVDYLLQNKAMYENKEQLSQKEYVKGISAWNFNLEDLKRQVALLDDNAVISLMEDLGTDNKSQGLSKSACEVDCLSSQTINDANSHFKKINNANSAAMREEDALHEFQNFEGLFSSSLQALKGYFDVCEDDTSTSSPDWSNVGHSSPENEYVPVQKQLIQAEDSEGNVDPQKLKFFSGSLLSESSISLYRNVSDDKNRDVIKQVKHPSLRNYSGPLTFRRNRDGYCEPFASTYQQRGRFKITSEDPVAKVICPANCVTTSLAGPHTSTTETSSSSHPLLQFILQQNAIQREQLSKLIGYMDQTSYHQNESVVLGSNWQSQLSPVSGRENVLLCYAAQLQQRIKNLVEEIQNVKIQNDQLQQELINGHSDKNNNQGVIFSSTQIVQCSDILCLNC